MVFPFITDSWRVGPYNSLLIIVQLSGDCGRIPLSGFIIKPPHDTVNNVLCLYWTWLPIKRLNYNTLCIVWNFINKNLIEKLLDLAFTSGGNKSLLKPHFTITTSDEVVW